MLLNYLKLSLRLMVRNPFFTFINVAGLSVGFAVFFILWPFTQAELKSDQYVKDYDRIFRPLYDWRWTENGGESWGHLNLSSMPSHISNEMRNHSQVEDVCRYRAWFNDTYTPLSKSDLVLSIDQKVQSVIEAGENRAICADRNFLQFFSIQLLQGNQNTALDLSESVVLSESMAKKIFSSNALNQQLKVNGKPFIVTGVFKDLPDNSHLQFDIIFSNSGKLAIWNSFSLDGGWCYHYFKLRKGADPLAKILNDNKDRLIGYYLEKKQFLKIDFLAQPLREVVFSQMNEFFKPKSKFTLNSLAVVSLVVLVMAWMNYINLTVSKTKTRFKEIAVRKVSGALMLDLFLQFVCQSTLINVLAVLIGLTVIQVVGQPFSFFFNIRVIPLWELPSDALLFLALVLVIGIVVTAAYPAWVSIRHNARQLLTRNVPSQKRITTTIFTTSQYCAALTMIVWILVMHHQMNFILNKDLGIDKDNVVVVNAPILGLEENGNAKMVDFVQQVQNESGIGNTSLSGKVWGDGYYNMELRKVGNEMFYGIEDQGGVDDQFISMYKIKMIAGRNFMKDEKGVTTILSRSAVQRLGFKSPEEAVGAIIEYNFMTNWKPIEIIGVVEDYRVHSFSNLENNTEEGKGQCLMYLNNAWPPAVPGRVSIKLNTAEVKSVIDKVEDIYHQHFPGNVFNWYFLEDNIVRQYGDLQILRNQLTFFTFLAVMVACLGLLGMISNTVSEKIKEISIRKILGAENLHVMKLLLNSTGMQVITALVTGLPIAWKFSQQYLEKYTERIALQWWHFGLPVMILITIMFLTISSVLWKAAKSNPVEALKYE